MAKSHQKPLKKSPAKPSTPASAPKKTNLALSFTTTNYIMMVAGVLVVALGFILMSGGKQQGAEFNESEIYSFTRITLAPIVVILGFVIEVIAIFWNYQSGSETNS